MTTSKKVIWFLVTCLIYLTLAVCLWRVDGYTADYAAQKRQEIQESSVQEKYVGNYKIIAGLNIISSKIIPAERTDAWYFLIASPVFLFSAAFYFLTKSMYRHYYETAAVEPERTGFYN